MSDPVRLLAGGATDFEEHLLRSWASKQPSDEARARALGLAGLGLAAGLTAAAASAASAAPASVAPASMVPASVASGVATASAGAKVSFASAVLIKWLAIGAVGVSLAAGAVGYILHTPATATGSPTSTPVHPAAAAVTTAPTLPIAPTATVATALTAPTAPAPPQAPDVVTAGPARAYGSTVRARETSTLDEEVATIERARRAVAAGDGAGAIAVVDAYDSRYPGGSLAQESMEIRIDALLRQGDRTTAERLASRFMAAHPSSPYVRRLRALLANSH